MTNKERIERLKYACGVSMGYGVDEPIIKLEDYFWLIENSEKLEKIAELVNNAARHEGTPIKPHDGTVNEYYTYGLDCGYSQVSKNILSIIEGEDDQ